MGLIWGVKKGGPTTIDFNIMLECGHRLQSNEEPLSNNTKILSEFLIDAARVKRNDEKIYPSFQIYCPNCKQERRFKFDSFTINWDHHLELV